MHDNGLCRLCILRHILFCPCRTLDYSNICSSTMLSDTLATFPCLLHKHSFPYMHSLSTAISYTPIFTSPPNPFSHPPRPKEKLTKPSLQMHAQHPHHPRHPEHNLDPRPPHRHRQHPNPPRRRTRRKNLLHRPRHPTSDPGIPQRRETYRLHLRRDYGFSRFYHHHHHHHRRSR